jgi:acyl-CoA synthetase (AMP-forming)/AMP-acid ligase II
VEECLLKNDAVKEAVVFGVKKNEFEYAVCSWVILKEHSVTSVDDLKQHCKTRLKSSNKVPSHIKIVDDIILIKNTSKYSRKNLAEVYGKELELLKN